MPTITVPYESEAERVAYQRAIDCAAEMLRAAQAVPDARVVDACEGLDLDLGRKLLRDTLGDAIQARVDLAEQEGGQTPCGHVGAHKGRRRRSFLTVLGPVALRGLTAAASPAKLASSPPTRRSTSAAR